MELPQEKPAHLQTGASGERLAAKWLKNKGFSIRGQHYLRKWGEIDIIAEKEGVVHFVEVKAVSYETRMEFERNVSRRTFSPEQHVTRQKLQRLYRAIGTWIAEKKYEGEYQLDVAAVYIVPREKYAAVDFIENVFLE